MKKIFNTYVIFPFVVVGMWLSWPLLKIGILRPKQGEKCGVAEMVNFLLLTVVGAIIFWLGLFSLVCWAIFR